MTYDELAKTLPDSDLIHDAKAAHQAIYVIGCFGTSDLRLNAAFCTELHGRGYEINDSGNELLITKDGLAH